jgi:hypothetical protein
MASIFEVPLPTTAPHARTTGNLIHEGQAGTFAAETTIKI